jgi:methyl-accepting chemotaxis protein
MRELAQGRFDVQLPGLQRKDEIGDIARAVENYKVVAAEKAKSEHEETQRLEAAASTERRAQMQQLATQFQRSVGTIIETVSANAGLLEGAAGTLAQTAAATQQLSSAVVSASEQASVSVKSAAESTSQLATSTQEIGRRVEDSTRIANEAVTRCEGRLLACRGFEPCRRTYRRCREADLLCRGTDQLACAQRHDRGSTYGRSR